MQRARRRAPGTPREKEEAEDKAAVRAQRNKDSPSASASKVPDKDLLFDTGDHWKWLREHWRR